MLIICLHTTVPHTGHLSAKDLCTVCNGSVAEKSADRVNFCENRVTALEGASIFLWELECRSFRWTTYGCSLQTGTTYSTSQSTQGSIFAFVKFCSYTGKAGGMEQLRYPFTMDDKEDFHAKKAFLLFRFEITTQLLQFLWYSDSNVDCKIRVSFNLLAPFCTFFIFYVFCDC